MAVSLNAQNFTLENDIRVKNDDFYYQHIDITYKQNIHNLFSPFVGFRFVNEDKEEWEHFSRFHVGFSSNKKTDWGKFSLRNRLEYVPDWGLDKDNLRHRIRIKYSPFSFGKNHISFPYFYNEFFFGLNDHFDYVRNRIGGGLETNLTKHLTSNFYYFSEKKQKRDWRHVNVFALSLKYKF